MGTLALVRAGGRHDFGPGARFTPQNIIVSTKEAEQEIESLRETTDGLVQHAMVMGVMGRTVPV